MALCSKSWTDINIDFGEKRIKHCCKSLSEKYTELDKEFINNSPEIIQRRTQSLQGNKHFHCNYCWNHDSNSGSSYRDIYNKSINLNKTPDELVEFIELKFNALPKENIIHFLKNICEKEKINIDNSQIEQIQELYNSDIRSMINYLQLNFRNTPNKLNIVNNSDFEYIFAILKQKGLEFEQFEKISEKIMAKYDLGIDGFIKKLIFFIFEKCPVLYGNSSYLDLLENIQKNINEDQILQYYWFNLIEYF